jgi:hypothetical protein
MERLRSSLGRSVAQILATDQAPDASLGIGLSRDQPRPSIGPHGPEQEIDLGLGW